MEAKTKSLECGGDALEVHLATLCSAFPFHMDLCEQILTHITKSARQRAAIALARRWPHPLDPAQ